MISFTCGATLLDEYSSALARTNIRQHLVTKRLLRLAYYDFNSLSGAHSSKCFLPPFHHRRLAVKKFEIDYLLSLSDLTIK